MRRILVLLACVLVTATSFAGDQLKSFDEIMNALKSGDKVSAVFYYAKCQLIADNAIEDDIPDAIGGMTIDTWEFFEKGSIRNDKAFVVSSTSKLIAEPRGDGYVMNYVKVKISDDNKVRIIARYIDPVTYETKMDESFYGDINDGKNDSGMHFFQK